MKIYFDKPENKLNTEYRVNFKTLLLDCERLHANVVFNIHDTEYLGNFKARDINKRTVELNNFVCQGELIYYKKNQFEWCNFGLDDIDFIEVHENIPNIEYFKGVAA